MFKSGKLAKAIQVLTVVTSSLCMTGPLTVSAPDPDKAVRGLVTHRISGCDYFVVATKSGYDLLEWYGGHDPDKDDIVIGKYEAYGFHDIYDETTDDTTRVWTEEYWLSKQDVLEKLADKCE
jgi:hypothetical protein